MSENLYARFLCSRDPMFLAYAGRDIEVAGKCWVLRLAFLPARRVMTRADEGRMFLAALHIRIRWIWQTSLDRALNRVRPRLSFYAWSDADEITTRIARRAGQLA